MFSSRPSLIRSLFVTTATIASLLVVVPAGGHDESEFQVVYAPFECGSEWVAPFGAHHSHPWNLDFNRTDLNWGENRQHDLGQPLFAQGNGTVVRIAVHHNAGTYVEIDYGDYTVVYVHLVHDSVADGVEVGAAVTTGQYFAQIGDTGNATGFAHLHIEYFDSRGFVDATSWELKNAGQPQTEVTFAGNSVDYNEAIVSNNCVGEAAGHPDPADGEIGLLTNPHTRVDHLIERLQPSTEALDGSNEAASYLEGTGTNLFARIPGSDLAAETVLVSTSYTSAFDCRLAGATEPAECPGATEHATSTLLALDLADAMAAAETPPRRTIVFAFWDERAEAGNAARAWVTDGDNPVIDDVVVAVDFGVLGADAALTLRRSTLATGFGNDWPALADRFTDYATPDLSVFAADRLARTTAIEIGGVAPATLAIADIAGPCVGTTADTPTVVNNDKLAGQTTEAIALVAELASAATLTEAGTGHDRTDASALLELTAMAGFTGGAYDALATALAAEDAAITAELATAIAQFGADVAAVPCAGHEPAAPFSDISPASYARIDAALMYDLGITRGTSTDRYSPNALVNREQMAAFLGRLWRLFHPDAVPTVDIPFQDVGAWNFAFDDIRLMYELEITRGSSETEYSPNVGVTREQMAAFLGRMWRALHPDHDPADVPHHEFVDIAPSSYADDDVSLMAWLGITTGTSDTTYAPGAYVSREQMAAFMARLVRAAGEG